MKRRGVWSSREKSWAILKENRHLNSAKSLTGGYFSVNTEEGGWLGGPRELTLGHQDARSSISQSSGPWYPRIIETGGSRRPLPEIPPFEVERVKEATITDFSQASHMSHHFEIFRVTSHAIYTSIPMSLCYSSYMKCAFLSFVSQRKYPCIAQYSPTLRILSRLPSPSRKRSTPLLLAPLSPGQEPILMAVPVYCTCVFHVLPARAAFIKLYGTSH